MELRDRKLEDDGEKYVMKNFIINKLLVAKYDVGGQIKEKDIGRTYSTHYCYDKCSRNFSRKA